MQLPTQSLLRPLLLQHPLPFSAIPVKLTMTQLLIRSLTQVQRLKLWQLQVCLFPMLQLRGQALRQFHYLLQWSPTPRRMFQPTMMQWLIQSLTQEPPLLIFWLRDFPLHTNPHTLLKLLMIPLILSQPHRIT